MNETREEHMDWCKQRASQYLDTGDVVNALASFASDVTKHPETDTPAVTMLVATEGMRCAMNNDVTGLRRLIEGFA